MTAEPVIVINGVSRLYPVSSGSFAALSDIELTIAAGEFSGLVGPSGSGKTTLLNLIGSLDAPTSGEIIVLGQKVQELDARGAARLRRDQLGFIFQTYNLLPVYTVFENVEFPLLLLQMERQKRRDAVMDILERVGLADRAGSRPAQLSGGECQRVAIARAMVKHPSLVLADEPTANLDADNSHRILQTMLTLNRDLGTTFLFATHDDKVIQYLRRVIVLFDGRIAQDEVRDETAVSAGTPGGYF
ncbi:MAG: ABC transporter ATP-binding protein [Candidatus Delongbacteria bacterium]|nr:ABC transporter ATP-binding protein [Candidatus Delongbacteria bacterium]